MLTVEQLSDYERAVVALESHEMFVSIGNPAARVIAVKAYDTVDASLDAKGKRFTTAWTYRVDARAARLLRECMAKNKAMEDLS